MKSKLEVLPSFLFLLFINILTPVYAADDNAKAVADQLNQLYARTQACDDNNPAYYCSGIIIHGREAGDELAWYLPETRTVGSFSYLRIDITPHVGRPLFSWMGFILAPRDEIVQQKQYQYPVHCAYASDGYTSGGANSSCGIVDLNNKNSDTSDTDFTCTGKEIKSLADYLHANVGKIELSQQQRDYFREFYGDEKFSRMDNSIALNGICSFSPDKASFDTAMQIHRYVYRDHPETIGCNWTDNIDDGDLSACYDNNELIIGAWQKSEVSANQVPIKAFYVIINDGGNDTEEDNADSIRELLKVSDEYSKEVRYARRIPVVVLDMAKLKAGSAEIFSPLKLPNKP